jgi:predicted ATPase
VIWLVNDDLDLLGRITHGPWIGRPREMAQASQIWQKAASGEGQVLLIDGEPGIGKTRFVQELTTQARAAGAHVMTGECFPEGSAPYAPVAQMIGDLFETTQSKGINLPIEILVI